VWLPAGPVGDANEFARQVLVLLAFVVHMVRSSGRPWPRRAAGATALCLVAIVFATRSRGGLVALVAMGLLAIALSARSRRQLHTWVVGFVAVVAVALGVATAAGITKDFADVGAYFGAEVPSDSSAALHASTFRAGLRMWVDHPVVGVGPGNFEQLYLPIAADLGIESTGKPRAAHNVVVELLAETGIVGLAVFAAMAVAVMWPMRPPLRRPVVLAASAFAVAGLTQGFGIHGPLLLIVSLGLIAHRPVMTVR
jgi:O-antigen ligase